MKVKTVTAVKKTELMDNKVYHVTCDLEYDAVTERNVSLYLNEDDYELLIKDHMYFDM